MTDGTLTPDQRDRVRDLVAAAMKLPTGDRRSHIEAATDDDSVRAEALSLLAHTDEDSFLWSHARLPDAGNASTEEGEATMVGTNEPRGSHDLAGTTIGPYKILQVIGEGGFGVVYMAEQKEPVRRRVALKIIKLGMDTEQVLGRFEAERQALALMDHPNIARVLDGGVTETGRPYFVMELVRGVPITQYCDTERLDTRRRLGLFTAVCHAIQHAHHKGIIHRDIKPSNVLITMHDGKPVPVVIDFGIAKAIDRDLTERTVFTEYRQFIGTPEYMSPEQAEMSGLDIDTRSDVYSLGVLLYELLIGVKPFDGRKLRQAAFDEMHRIIREEEPAKPSTRLSGLTHIETEQGIQAPTTVQAIARQRATDARSLGRILRGDLDWIVLKALEKDRTRRYETADGFAEDIRRYLENEEVLASPPSASYRVKKLVKRHRGPVASLAAIFVLLVGGIVGTTLGMTRAASAAERANRELARATEVKQLVIEMLASASPHIALGRDTTILEAILDDTADDLAAGEVEDPVIEAELHALIGGTYFALDDREAADRHFRSALAIRTRELHPDHPDVLTSTNDLAALRSRQREYGEAKTLATAALEARRRTLGADDPMTLESLSVLGSVLRRQGHFDAAEAHLRELLEARRRVLGPQDPATLLAMNKLGLLLKERGEFEEAGELLLAALDGRLDVLGENHPETLDSMSAIGSLRNAQGRYAEAVRRYREVVEVRRRIQGDDHVHTLKAINNLGSAYRRLGRLDEAERYLAEAWERRRATLPEGDADLAVSTNAMGILRRDQGRLDEAEALLAESLALRREAFPRGHRRVVLAAVNLAGVWNRQERYDDVIELLGEFDERAWQLTVARPGSRIDPGDVDHDREPGETRRVRRGDDVREANPNLLGELGVAFTGAGEFAAAERVLLLAHEALENDVLPRRRATAAARLADLYDAWHAADPSGGHNERARAWRTRADDSG